MTVNELIVELRYYPPDAVVCVLTPTEQEGNQWCAVDEEEILISMSRQAVFLNGKE